MNFIHEPPLWRRILKKNFVNWEKLADFLELTAEQRKFILPKTSFVLNLPLRLAQKIAKGTLDDPILKQFLPTVEENKYSLDCVEDPVHDKAFCRTPKLLQKYQGRALLICTNACAMHCRYCFRQNFPYQKSNHLFEEELKEIAQDTSLKEVILSGGDPLSLSNESLKTFFDQLSEIPHIRRVRFHTRFPMGIPERIDPSFLDLLKNFNKQLWFVIHANHAAEFDEDIWMALTAIRKIGINVLNQSVLLRGVNDSVETLKSLCEELVDHGVLPYYLHQLDRVQGAAHFEVSEETGRFLVEELRSQLSGYAVPMYVREIAGEPNKTPL